MYRIPTQFNPQGSHAEESAAAGGSTTSTCSSCVVTLGSSALMTSIYFSSLREPVIKPAPSTIAAVKSVSGSDPEAAHAPHAELSSAQSIPMPNGKLDNASATLPAGSGGILLGVLGFVTPAIAFAPLLSNLTGLVTDSIIYILIWVSLFIFSYRHTGRSARHGAATGGLAGLAMLATTGLLWLGIRNEMTNWIISILAWLGVFALLYHQAGRKVGDGFLVGGLVGVVMLMVQFALGMGTWVVIGMSMVMTAVYFSQMYRPVPPTPAGRSSLAIFGFFTPLIALGVLGIGYQNDLLVASIISVLVWLSLFAFASHLAGRSAARGLVAGVAGLVMLGVAGALEVAIWFGLVFQ